jgi:DNA repair protein RadC
MYSVGNVFANELNSNFKPWRFKQKKERVMNVKYKEKKMVDQEGREVAWRHPGGKLRRLGPTSLTDTELLTVILGSGSIGRSAEEIACEIIGKYYSLQGLMGKTIGELMTVKGLKEVKATQIAAVFEVARRIVKALERE